VLTWTPGDYVADYAAGQQGNGHHVFFHTNMSYVSGANLHYPLGTAIGHFRAVINSFNPSDSPDFGIGGPLNVSTTYYWLVIEVDDTNPASPWVGELWSFTTISGKASDPQPASPSVVGLETGEVLDVELSWTAGPLADGTDGHQLFLGTSLSNVTNASVGTSLGVYLGTTTDPCDLVEDLMLDTTYYWRVDEVNDSLGTVKGDIWNFATDSGIAKNPTPSDTLTDVDPDMSLSWQVGFAAAQHDVYLGTASGMLDPFSMGQSETTADPWLELNTTYYWRVDEVNSSYPKSPWIGNEWSFTTHSGKAGNPTPSNGLGGILLNQQLSWTVGARAVSHDVYFGTVSPPPFIQNQPGTTYNPGMLSYGITYYWQINEKQAGGETTTGDIWSFSTASGPANVTVDVDQTTTYQIIDGFGAHGAMNVWWSNGPFYNSPFLDLVIDDLGLTIVRNEYYPKPDEPGQWPKQIPYLQAIKAKAQASGEPLKFIATYWTPPSYMKSNGSTKNGGYLLPEYYDEFGDYAVATIQDYKNIGIDLYALSMQNEPAFQQPYNSCLYMHDQYRDMIKIAGPVINASFPDTKLFMVEHMLNAYEYPDSTYETLIISDPQALQWADIWAVHGYGNDGATPDPDSTEATRWTAAKDKLEPTGRPFWMTETSGYSESWADSRQLAQSMFASLKYGHASAWVWWQLSENNGYGNPPGNYVLMNLGVPGKRYYVSKQFYRYIRPEAVMVDSVSNNDEVLVAAFTHQGNGTVTVLMINAGQSEKLVSLNLSGDLTPVNFDIYRTSAMENCVNVGSVAPAGPVLLPASSVTTLYGTAPSPLNFEDFAESFAPNWRRSDCDPGNQDCDGADSTGDGSVLLDDLKDFADDWLLSY